MTPEAVAKISFIVMLFDGLGLFLAVALSLYIRQTPFDLQIWALTLLPLTIIGTVIAVWQAVKELSKGDK